MADYEADQNDVFSFYTAKVNEGLPTKSAAETWSRDPTESMFMYDATTMMGSSGCYVSRPFVVKKASDMLAADATDA